MQPIDAFVVCAFDFEVKQIVDALFMSESSLRHLTACRAVDTVIYDDMGSLSFLFANKCKHLSAGLCGAEYMSGRGEAPVVSLQAIGRLTDKVENGFVEVYRSLFQDLMDRPIRLLEVGIFKGGSLLLWNMLFRHPQARFIGVDRSLPDIRLPPRVSAYICDQNDSEGLKTIARDYGPFDIVIDDGAHYPRESRNCFDVLFDHVGPGGFYVIEDCVVGYWSDMRSMGVFPPSFETVYRPEYDGMVRLIAEIMENAIRLKVRGLNIQYAGSRSFACFQKAA